MWKVRGLLMAGLAGCSITFEEFNEQRAELECARMNACLSEVEGSNGRLLACDARAVTSEEPPALACDFDAAAASACLADLEVAECDPELSVVVIPVVCADVCPPVESDANDEVETSTDTDE
jgi:hypothetical protein